MPKAGLFAGEVTQEAPADGAVTTKDKGYPWMEWGNVATAPEQSRVLAWWEFEEPSGGTGTLLYDEVAGLVFRSNNAYTSVTGVVGQAARLAITGAENHDNSTLLNPNASLIPLTLRDQVFSVSFWWTTPAILTGMEGTYLISYWKYSSPVYGQGDRKWVVRYNDTADGFVYSIGNDIDPAVFVSIDTGDISLAINTKYHICITHDPDADEMTLTVSEDGGLVGTRLTETVAGGAYDGGAPSTGYGTYLGRDFSGAPNSLSNGAIDILGFWDETSILSEADVSQLFNYKVIYSGLTI
jgi:hypothetical protein